MGKTRRICISRSDAWCKPETTCRVKQYAADDARRGRVATEAGYSSDPIRQLDVGFSGFFEMWIHFLGEQNPWFGKPNPISHIPNSHIFVSRNLINFNFQLRLMLRHNPNYILVDFGNLSAATRCSHWFYDFRHILHCNHYSAWPCEIETSMLSTSAHPFIVEYPYIWWMAFEKTQTILIITYNNIQFSFRFFGWRGVPGCGDAPRKILLNSMCLVCGRLFPSSSSRCVCVRKLVRCMSLSIFFEWFSCQNCLMYVLRRATTTPTRALGIAVARASGRVCACANCKCN